MVTVGCASMKSSATVCQYALPGPSSEALCHQVRVTSLSYGTSADGGSVPPPLLHALANSVVVASAAKMACVRRVIAIGVSSMSVRDLDVREFYSPVTDCQSVSITFAKRAARALMIAAWTRCSA
jgi:hypothetical protein